MRLNNGGRTRKMATRAPTPAKRLADLFGSGANLARAIPVDQGVVSRWDSEGRRGNMGRVPTHYNIAILEAARRLGIDLAAVSACLDEHECPCCKRPLEPGAVISREHLHRVLK